MPVCAGARAGLVLQCNEARTVDHGDIQATILDIVVVSAAHSETVARLGEANPVVCRQIESGMAITAFAPSTSCAALRPHHPPKGLGANDGVSGGDCVTKPTQSWADSAGRNKVRALDGGYNWVSSAFN